jgi:hypothetical protein
LLRLFELSNSISAFFFSFLFPLVTTHQSCIAYLKLQPGALRALSLILRMWYLLTNLWRQSLDREQGQAVGPELSWWLGVHQFLTQWAQVGLRQSRCGDEL